MTFDFKKKKKKREGAERSGCEKPKQKTKKQNLCQALGRREKRKKPGVIESGGQLQPDVLQFYSFQFSSTLKTTRGKKQASSEALMICLTQQIRVDLRWRQLWIRAQTLYKNLSNSNTVVQIKFYV